MATVHGPLALDHSSSPASTDTIDGETAPPINAHKTALSLLALYSLDLALGHTTHDINKFALSFTHLLFQSTSQNDNEFPSPNLQKS
ncbi:hypothetical protein K503DRAFT_805716 [Rhizopogon vinicolor AM-OR11-026]|uniref:Uncharacterized protein n=1 Tax=Rhizopogon vinicolor AM-OR11-026 TaxID=1314800 RepID=A0A1B7MH01_9AGAM|nr:hypothetical protein K503DRAFT_805716 [Rhizopogon vinicolor AM-OR11-026]